MSDIYIIKFGKSMKNRMFLFKLLDINFIYSSKDIPNIQEKTKELKNIHGEIVWYRRLGTKLLGRRPTRSQTIW